MATIEELFADLQADINFLRGPQLEASGFEVQEGALSLEEGLSRATPTTQREFATKQRQLKLAQDVAATQGFGTQNISVDVEGIGSFRGPAVAFQELVKQRTQEFEQLKAQITRGLAKTPERLEREARAKQFEDTQIGTFEAQLNLLNQQIEQIGTQQEAFRAAQESAGEISAQQAEQIKRALAGDIPASEALEQQREQEFRQVQEKQGRMGNTILGDTLAEAVGKGTAAQLALKNLRQRFGILEQQERQSILAQQLPLFQQGLGQLGAFQTGAATIQPQIGRFAGSTPGLTGALPIGLQQTAFQTAQLGIPTQLQQLGMAQQQQLMQAQLHQQSEQARRAERSQLIGGGLSLLGSVGGGFASGIGTGIGAGLV